MLGKSPIKWRQRPDMTFAVDWDVKHQFKNSTNSNVYVSDEVFPGKDDVSLENFAHPDVMKVRFTTKYCHHNMTEKIDRDVKQK